MNTPSALAVERPLTHDSLFAGAVVCRQFQDGYRFSVDAVLAAHFHEPAKGERVLDLGSGSGIISLILMYRWAERITSCHALEYQQQLCELAEQNFRDNNFGDVCTSLHGDVKDIARYLRAESFSLVVCNPPFYRPDHGRQSRGGESRIARHQVTADIDDFAGAAAFAVKNGGSVVFIYPAEQFTILSTALLKVKLEIKQLRFVYSYPDTVDEARLVLVKCLKNGGAGVKILPPLYIYDRKNGDYSPEMQRLYEPRAGNCRNDCRFS